MALSVTWWKIDCRGNRQVQTITINSGWARDSVHFHCGRIEKTGTKTKKTISVTF